MEILNRLISKNEFPRPRCRFKAKASSKKQILYQKAIDGYVIKMLLEEENPKGGLLDVNMWIESGGQLRVHYRLENCVRTFFLSLRINQQFESSIKIYLL